MAVELAVAYLSIVPETSKIAPGVKQALGQSAKTADGAGRTMGSRLSGAIGKTMKRTGIGVGVATGAVIATGLTKGFGRLRAIDEAQAKLRGLKLSGDEISGVMEDVGKAVTGTAFGLDEAATASASALASGIEPGKELTRYLTLIGDAATQGGTSFNEMGAIINKTTSRGKVGMENLNQLSERGMGIMEWLAEHYKVSGEELTKMVSKGEVDAATFRKVLEKNIGGAAQESGKTFSGSLANMNAALGRLGARVLEGAFSQMPGIFSDIGGSLDKLAPYAEAAGDAIGEGLTSAVEFIGPHAKTAAEGLGDLAGLAWPKITKGVKALRGLTDLDFSSIDGKKLGKQIGSAISDGLAALGSLAKDLTQRFSDLMSKVDWAGIGIEVGKQAPALLLGLAAGLLSDDALGNLFSAIADNWQLVLMGAITLAFAPAKLLAPLTRILGKIPFVGSLLANGVRWVNEGGRAFLRFLGDLFSTAWKGFTSIVRFPGGGLIKAIMGSLRALPGNVKDFFVLLQVRLGVWALNAFGAIGRAAGRGVRTTISFMAGLPGMILRAIGGLARLLAPKGVELMTGLWTAARAKFGEVVSWVRGAPGRIAGAFGDAKGILVGAGKDVVQGLINGIGSMAGAVGRKVREIAGSVKDGFTNALKIFSPSRVTLLIGQQVGQGLVNGLRDYIPKSRSAAAGLARTVASSLRDALQSKGADGLSGVLDRVSKQIDRALSNKDIGKKAAKNMQATVKAVSKQLTRLGKEYDKASERLKSLQDAHKSMRESVASALTGELDLGSTISEPNQFGFGGGTTTFAAVASHVAGLAARVKTFAARLSALLKAGLPRELVSEVAALGTEKGLAVANALLTGSKTQIGKLKTDWAALHSSANQAGIVMANAYYATGIAAQQGLIAGLLDDKRLNKAAKQLSKKLTKQIKKALGIRSPSRLLYREVGLPSGQGIVAGELAAVEAGQRDISRAMTAVVAPPRVGAADMHASAGAGGGRVFSDADLQALVAALRAQPIKLFAGGSELARFGQAIDRAGVAHA